MHSVTPFLLTLGALISSSVAAPHGARSSDPPKNGHCPGQDPETKLLSPLVSTWDVPNSKYIAEDCDDGFIQREDDVVKSTIAKFDLGVLPGPIPNYCDFYFRLREPTNPGNNFDHTASFQLFAAKPGAFNIEAAPSFYDRKGYNYGAVKDLNTTDIRGPIPVSTGPEYREENNLTLILDSDALEVTILWTQDYDVSLSDESFEGAFLDCEGQSDYSDSY